MIRPLRRLRRHLSHGERLTLGSPSRRPLPIETVGEGSPLPKALIRTKTQTGGDAPLVIFVGAFSELPQTTYGSPTKRRLIRSIVRQPFLLFIREWSEGIAKLFVKDFLRFLLVALVGR